MSPDDLDTLAERIALRVAAILSQRPARCTTCMTRDPVEGRKTCRPCLDRRKAAYEANPEPRRARARERDYEAKRGVIRELLGH